MLNSSFIQGFELDDYHPLAPLHSNSLVLPAMLAAAPHLGRVSRCSPPLRTWAASPASAAFSARLSGTRPARGSVRRSAAWT